MKLGYIYLCMSWNKTYKYPKSAVTTDRMCKNANNVPGFRATD